MLSTNEKNYFPLEKNVAIPTIGYFNFIKNLAKDIKINTNVNINNKVLELSNNNIVVFTGSVDELFNYKFGQLQYRSLKFDIVKEDWSFDVGCVNLPQHPNYTRKSNFNYFYNFQQTNEYVCYETPCYYNGTNLRLYPISSNTSNAEIYTKYKSELGKYQNIFLAGRAGTYKYLDMDKIIAQAFEIANEIINKYKM
jgi:UDP-galactopyranose mutase